MKLRRSNRFEQRPTAKDVLGETPPEKVYPPEDILTAPVIARILEIKKELDTATFFSLSYGEYAYFLAAARLCLPEYEVELRPSKNRQQEIRQQIQLEFSHLPQLEPRDYSHEILKIKEYALVAPLEVGEILKKCTNNVLESITQESTGERPYLAASLAVALWISVPEARSQLAQVLAQVRPHLLKVGKEVGWNVAANMCLIDPEYKVAFELTEFFTKERATILKELPKLTRNKALPLDVRKWAWVLNGVFALAVTTASDVSLQSNGIAQYRFTPKRQPEKRLPARPQV